MHSSRMHTIHSVAVFPSMHTFLLCMPPATCAPCHACLLPCMPPPCTPPLPHMPPAMHYPCHACPHATHALLPHMTPAMHTTPAMHAPLPHMSPCNAHPLCHAHPPATHPLCHTIPCHACPHEQNHGHL